MQQELAIQKLRHLDFILFLIRFGLVRFVLVGLGGLIWLDCLGSLVMVVWFGLVCLGRFGLVWSGYVWLSQLRLVGFCQVKLVT
jgi:hypothetical protein